MESPPFSPIRNEFYNSPIRPQIMVYEDNFSNRPTFTQTVTQNTSDLIQKVKETCRFIFPAVENLVFVSSAALALTVSPVTFFSGISLGTLVAYLNEKEHLKLFHKKRTIQELAHIHTSQVILEALLAAASYFLKSKEILSASSGFMAGACAGNYAFHKVRALQTTSDLNSAMNVFLFNAYKKKGIL